MNHHRTGLDSLVPSNVTIPRAPALNELRTALGAIKKLLSIFARWEFKRGMKGQMKGTLILKGLVPP